MSYKFNPFTGTFDIAEAGGGGGAPGGSSGQLQWNNSGSFDGLSTTAVDGSGNLTFTARWIQSTNGAASAPAHALTGTWFTGGTSTTTKPQLLIEPAGTTSTNWSTAGTGLGVNAPSGFLGSVVDFQVGGSRRFAVTYDGIIISNNNAVLLSGGANTFLYASGFENARISHLTLFEIPSTAAFSWAPGSNISVIPDLLLYRDAANTLAQRNGTNAQTSRIYNTFTSATNFERLNVRWTSNEAIIDTEAGSGGGTLRGLKIGSASTNPLGFYGATPIVQPAAVADATDNASAITQLNLALARLRSLGLIAT